MLYPEGELVGKGIFNFIKYLQTISKLVKPFYIPTSNEEKFQPPHILSNTVLGMVSLFNFSV